MNIYELPNEYIIYVQLLQFSNFDHQRLYNVYALFCAEQRQKGLPSESEDSEEEEAAAPVAKGAPGELPPSESSSEEESDDGEVCVYNIVQRKN